MRRRGGPGDERLSPARRELAFGVAFVAGEGEAARRKR